MAISQKIKALMTPEVEETLLTLLPLPSLPEKDVSIEEYIRYHEVLKLREKIKNVTRKGGL